MVSQAILYIYTDVQKRPMLSYMAWTLLVWIVTAIHFVFIAATPSSLILNYVWTGVVALGLIGFVYHLCRVHSMAGWDTWKIIMLVLTMFTFCWATSFAGIYLGGELQDYWHYNRIPSYHNVDVINVKNVGYEGRFSFTSSAAIVPRFGGAKYYYDLMRQEDHWVCVLPLLPVNASSDEPPRDDGASAAPFDVRFWVRADDECCGDPTLVPCMNPLGWKNAHQYGVSYPSSLKGQADALAAACATWPKNDTSAPRTLTATHPVFIQWTTPDDFNHDQQARVLIVGFILTATLVFWPGWLLIGFIALWVLCEKGSNSSNQSGNNNNICTGGCGLQRRHYHERDRHVCDCSSDDMCTTAEQRRVCCRVQYWCCCFYIAAAQWRPLPSVSGVAPVDAAALVDQQGDIGDIETSDTTSSTDVAMEMN